ncbi:DUF892 family protein [Halorarum salinum]|uniref:DUF892 family protein n=1 Tax=Halorarum salinum TaxID=2743089 RepID=A0A7D5QJ87_9EURY|nr:DUF892 family protein [Halobaculum salinum]QLG61245.1 DUF892 family protein [Halobaculum salinum]
MTIDTKEETFERGLRKLYRAEIEILDLHADLAAAAASEEVRDVFSGHEGDTVDQIDRIEEPFEVVDLEPRERGSPIVEGLLAEKDEFVAEVNDDDLRDLDAISVGMINERFEITLLDRLLLLADALGLPEPTRSTLKRNRAEARAALERMERFLEERRVGRGTTARSARPSARSRAFRTTRIQGTGFHRSRSNGVHGTFVSSHRNRGGGSDELARHGGPSGGRTVCRSNEPRAPRGIEYGGSVEVLHHRVPSGESTASTDRRPGETATSNGNTSRLPGGDDAVSVPPSVRPVGFTNGGPVRGSRSILEVNGSAPSEDGRVGERAPRTGPSPETAGFPRANQSASGNRTIAMA